MNRSGLLVLLAIATGGLASCSAPEGPLDLVVISLDTVRRDHLPTYGYGRDTAPGLDILARSSAVFENAFAQHTRTVPSHASMFTGLYPHAHGSRDNTQPLPGGAPTLAEILGDAGFRTAAFVSGFPMKREASRFERGFEVYADDFEDDTRLGGETAKLALEWLRERDPTERAFLFLHLYDAHGPYLPPTEYRGTFVSGEPGPELPRIPPYQVLRDERGEPVRNLNVYVDLYDSEIRYVDDVVRTVVGQIDLERTVIVVIADHGETLGERYHVLDHGGQVFDEQVRIPLILHAPGLEAARVVAPVETVDLLPTALELLGVVVPPELEMQGRSLAPLLDGPVQEGPRLVFSSSGAGRRHGDRGYQLDSARNIVSVRSERWKLIRYPGIEADYHELYDLEADPGESANVLEDHPDVADEYRGVLRAWLEDAPELPVPQEVDPEVLERLRSLGYVD